MKLILLLPILLFLGCVSEPINSCKTNSDCFLGVCVDGICQDDEVCENESDCENGNFCINGKCREGECVQDSHCNSDEICINFTCLSQIERKGTGESCANYNDAECLSQYCIQDEFGAYCSTVCNSDSECPSHMICEPLYGNTTFCRYGFRDVGDYSGGYGSSCDLHGESDCQTDLTCVQNIENRDISKCLPTCLSDNDCYLGYECRYHSDGIPYCMPPKYRSTGELCAIYGGLECINSDDLCIAIHDSEPVCTRVCNVSEECGSDYSCFDGYCLKTLKSGFGERCDVSGSYQCDEELFCDFSSSRVAVCTKECENDLSCGDYFSCSVTIDGQRLCRAASNGLGDRDGLLGDSCSQHGDSDCSEPMLCLSGFEGNEKAYCTMHCDNDSDCGDNFYCGDPTRTGHNICVKGVRGEMGAGCSNSYCNSGLFCKTDNVKDLTAFCTKVCSTVGEECLEKDGYFCNQIYSNFNICLDKEPTIITKGEIGDACPNGYRDCQEGLSCIFDFSLGSICSKECSDSELCPDGTECRVYNEVYSFCYRSSEN
ncbi:hypothetical protein JXR93_04490 [bacterium]|nr:hypothetical protein [bacterium]